MKTLHLATEEDADKLLPLVAAFHAERGYATDADHRLAAVAPLLAGSPHGAIWLIGPRRSPVGYVAVTFGWSIEFGGRDATLDELYVRPAVRRRGMGFEALNGIVKAMRGAEVKALHLEADSADSRLVDFYRRARFAPRQGHVRMSRAL
jgi:GNAT superfamily N-acetyltransferase